MVARVQPAMSIASSTSASRLKRAGLGRNGRFVLGPPAPDRLLFRRSAKRLTSEERLFAIRSPSHGCGAGTAQPPEAMLKADWTVRHDPLTIDLLPLLRAFRRTAGTAGRRARGGSPSPMTSPGGTFGHQRHARSGSRRRGRIGGGVPAKEILEDYPSLDRDRLELAALWGQPRRTARSRSSPDCRKVRILGSSRVPRRQLDEVPDRRCLSPKLTRRLCSAPRHQVIDLGDLVVGNAGESVSEPGVGIDGVELGRFDQGVGDGSGVAARLRPTKRWFFRPRAMARMPRSAVLLSNSRMPWSR